MITKNYIRFLSMCKSLTINSNRAYINLYLTNYSGEDIHWDYLSDGVETNYNGITAPIFTDTSLSSLTTETPSTGLLFGSGGGTPSQDDYCLSNPIEFSDTGLSIIKSYCELMPDKNTIYLHTRFVKNNSDAPISISESGLFTCTRLTGFYSSPESNTVFLWAKNTFEPVIIQPGEIKGFNMSIQI